MIQEFFIIFIINYIGIIISAILNIPIPGTIIGVALFFLLLYFKILKAEKIENAASFLLINMTIFFLPPGVRILDYIHHLDGEFLKVIFLIVFTTFITMGITGKVVEVMIELLEKKKKILEKEEV